MPGMAREKLTAEGRKRLAAVSRRVSEAEADLDAARTEWAKVVRNLGISACARDPLVDLTPQAVSERLLVIERKAAHKR